uniref:Putative calcineurin-like phosphoesterase n=1 Tax=viral metagenome TaxID=1070528 RepID=A0A6M3KSE6_9ZZZZ
MDFCKDLRRKWKTKMTVFIGDVVDSHAISFHRKEPGCPGPLDEYKQAKKAIQQWYKAFPKAIVTLGNHDKRVVRLAKSVQIPELYLKSYKEIWDTPKWDWVEDIIIDDVFYYHGDGQGGEYPAANAVRKMLMSVVMGHIHTASGVKYYTNPQRRIFACDVGAGCDDRAMAFAYADRNKRRSVISAAVVIDGIPYVEPCPIGRGEKYHDSRFKNT